MRVLVLLLSLLVTCMALVSIRPSESSNLDRCSLSSHQQTAKPRCLMNCWQDPCCLAVDVSSCEKSYLPTESLHFVKEVSSQSRNCNYQISIWTVTPFLSVLAFSLGVPMGVVDDCSCRHPDRDTTSYEYILYVV